MNTLILQILLWVSIGVVVYTYAAYPVILWVAAKLSRPCRSIPSSEFFPFVSLIIAAYKEDKVIVQRLTNALTLNYPADRYEVLVGCDGNEDLTGELVRTFDDHRIRLIQYPVRRGKASVLNDTVPQAQGEILIFSDANTDMHPDALRNLARHFTASFVGGVCGQLILQDAATGKNVDGVYWKYENFLKKKEADLGALLGVNGGIYAIRKELFQPIPANTIIDDFLIGMRIHEQGYELLYDPTAIAYEETAETIQAEFQRRIRIGAGGFQSLVWLWKLLDPRRGWIAFCFLSHKLLRWVCPFFMLTAYLSNLLLIDDIWYARLFIMQTLFYLTAAAGLWCFHEVAIPRWMRLPSMFVSMNAALFFGFFRWLRGIRSGTWKRTERSPLQPGSAG